MPNLSKLPSGSLRILGAYILHFHYKTILFSTSPGSLTIGSIGLVNWQWLPSEEKNGLTNTVSLQPSYGINTYWITLWLYNIVSVYQFNICYATFITVFICIIIGSISLPVVGMLLFVYASARQPQWPKVSHIWHNRCYLSPKIPNEHAR